MPFQPVPRKRKGRRCKRAMGGGIETSLRYQYVYSEDELCDFMPDVRRMDERAASTFVMFNNCYRASGIKNALELKELLPRARQAGAPQ